MDTATVQHRRVEDKHEPSFLILLSRAFAYIDNLNILDLILNKLTVIITLVQKYIC